MGESIKPDNKFMKKLTTMNPWGIITGIIFFLLLGIIGYYFYLMSIKSDLKNIKVKKEQILQKNKIKYKTEVNDMWYKKYQAAKILYKDDTKISRKKTIAYLIKKYDKIRSIDIEDTNMTLEEFQLNVEGKISMVGTVHGITHVFAPQQGILDKFIKFDFLEHLEVQSYERIGEEDNFTNDFTFILNATLKSHDSN